MDSTQYSFNNYKEFLHTGFQSLVYGAQLLRYPNRGMSDDTGKELTAITFNQDSQCLAIGHEGGYEFYPLAKNTEKVVVEHRNTQPETILVERLLGSGLAMVVSRKEPRTMHVRHVNDRKTIHDQRFSSSILNIKVNRQRVVVCLENAIYIYNLTDMKQLHTIDGELENKSGLLDLSLGNSILVYPGNSLAGTVHIFDATVMKAMFTIPAHESRLAAIRLDSEGNKLATASEKGTVIRVFSVKKDQQWNKLWEFRRGVARAVTITQLAFSIDSSFLVSSSNTETIHIFKLHQSDETQTISDNSYSGWMSWAISTVASYLPPNAQLLEKSFATAHLPTQSRAYAALPTIGQEMVLVVATADGHLYYYKVDKERGGECLESSHIRIGPHAQVTELDSQVDDIPPSQHPT
ncbi:unnamed protein product, partial [Mesorhabditis belari]|uniref:WD repeat domain phosphoinositide-interacting protein 2 n=1 Tax=Mesorhabditis belari TaxID=2138241 RepID=A0AAF3JB20_9BILA